MIYCLINAHQIRNQAESESRSHKLMTWDDRQDLGHVTSELKLTIISKLYVYINSC